MILALTSRHSTRGRDVRRRVDRRWQQKLSQVEGVGQVIVGGGALPAVRVELNPQALCNNYGLGLEQVRDGARRSEREPAQGTARRRRRRRGRSAPTISCSRRPNTSR